MRNQKSLEMNNQKPLSPLASPFTPQPKESECPKTNEEKWNDSYFNIYLFALSQVADPSILMAPATQYNTLVIPTVTTPIVTTHRGNIFMEQAANLLPNVPSSSNTTPQQLSNL